MKEAWIIVTTAALAGLGGVVIHDYTIHRPPTFLLWAVLAVATWACVSSVVKYRKANTAN
jgi:uncharacterized membrane protein YeiH